MFVGSSYNETLSGDLGDTLSQVSDKSSNYFTSDLEHRHRQFQVGISVSLDRMRGRSSGVMRGSFRQSGVRSINKRVANETMC